MLEYQGLRQTTFYVLMGPQWSPLRSRLAMQHCIQRAPALTTFLQLMSLRRSAWQSGTANEDTKAAISALIARYVRV